MPSRTYTGIDLTAYTEVDSISDLISGNGVASHSVLQSGNANFTISPTGSISSNAGPAQAAALFTGTYTATGTFNFDTFPSIPDGATINSIKVKVNLSFNITAIGVASTAISGTINLSVAVKSLPIDFTYSDLTISASVGQSAGSINLNGADSVTFSTEQVLDLAPGITKAALEADYSQFRVLITITAIQITGTVVPDLGLDGDVSGSIVVNNFEFEVNYTDGPAITLTPSGGNIESGQTIEVESPDVNVQNLKYAALQGNNVIPLIPKDNPDGTVTLTIPNPASDDCIDALADCPECDDCFTACSEDLESEACQACMQACLDCLTTLFENLELAEECNESTHEPPGVVPITIICSGPEFTGSVPLGTFTILETNGSGIYQFQTGQTHDTLYSSSRDGSTYDVKIPNPFAKTGFFRS